MKEEMGTEGEGHKLGSRKESIQKEKKYELNSTKDS